MAYPINGLNQTGVNGGPLPYDAKGNLLGDGVHAFTYDQANKLRGVTGPATGTLTYDALDRLSILTGTQGATYVYAGSAEIAALANTGSALNNRFVRGPRPDELLVSYAGTSGTLSPVWWINDPQGSAIAVTQVNGSTTGIWTYDEYGQRGPNNGLRTQYTGQLWLPDFGVYHYKARAYHPGLGRFLQTDPVGYGAGMNLYGYVGNDPVNNTDPSGMIQQDQRPAPSGCTASRCLEVEARNADGTIVRFPVPRPNLEDMGPVGLVISVGASVGQALWNEATSDGNDNPYDGPVDEPVVVVDEAGNAIPVGAGEQVTSSPDGDYQQVRDREGRPTGIRADRGGHRGQADETARGPHGHRPDVTRPGENPHLPIRPRLPREP